jgi:hypothetical protein
MKKDKKGMELSLNVIIIAAILLITALVVIVIFSGSVSDFVKDLFGMGCAGKIKAQCMADPAGNFKLGEGELDSVIEGKCTGGDAEISAKCKDYRSALKAQADNDKKAAATKSDTSTPSTPAGTTGTG